jgi:hypothetical protein
MDTFAEDLAHLKKIAEGLSASYVIAVDEHTNAKNALDHCEIDVENAKKTLDNEQYQLRYTTAMFANASAKLEFAKVNSNSTYERYKKCIKAIELLESHHYDHINERARKRVRNEMDLPIFASPNTFGSQAFLISGLTASPPKRIAPDVFGVEAFREGF